MIRKLSAGLILAIITAAIFSSCSKEAPPTPELPPEEAFDIAFDEFSEESGKMDDAGGVHTNHNSAVGRVLFWNIGLALNVAIPMAAFKGAFAHEATWNSDDEYFFWEYTTVAVLATYTCNLQARLDEDGQNINWSMYLSKSGAGNFDNFLWYTGRSNLDRKSGTWSLFKSPSDPTAYLDMTWSNDLAGTASVKFTNVVPSGSDNGSYLEFGRSLTTDETDRFYNIYRINDNKLVAIKWHKTNKDGSITIGADAKACWDGTYHNLTCN